MHCMGKKKMKTELKITLFVSHINCCYCHTMNGKIERISILLLDQPETFFLGENTRVLFCKKKDVKVWSNLRVQRPPKGKLSIEYSMYCLWTIPSSANVTTKPSPKWHSNQLRECGMKKSKALYYTIYTLHNLWPHSIYGTIKENQIVVCQYSTGLLLVIVVVVPGDDDCDGDGNGIVICSCILSVKFQIEWELDRNRLVAYRGIYLG